MLNQTTRDTWRDRLVLVAFVIATAFFYTTRLETKTPGYYLDESSIAYNALSIARTGRDEHGARTPLYFEAFGEYKNPVYIYALASVFLVVEPSVLVTRRFSAVLGYLAAVVLAVLAHRLARNRVVTLAVFVLALVTPALFEVSRLVFEVAAYPLVMGLFLLATRHAYERPRWTAANVASLVATLCLLTYTYSIGRLLAPLMAIGLIAFATRERARGLALVFAGFALLGVLPVVAYNHVHGGALTARYASIGYAHRFAEAPLSVITTFETQLLRNLSPLGISLIGDPNPRHHVPGSGGSVLLGVIGLAIAGLVIGLRSPHRRWWSFVAYALFASFLPASLTRDTHHMLRLVAVPVLLLVATVPALTAIFDTSYARGQRTLATLCLMAALCQSVVFTRVFMRRGADRGAHFDAGFETVLEAALAQQRPPIVLACGDAYIHALWFGALRGVPGERFVRASPQHLPPSAVVITDARGCAACERLARGGRFAAVTSPGAPAAP